MSWGVNLGLAGATARGMHEREVDDANAAFLEKSRDYELKKMQSEESMRPLRDQLTRDQLGYQSKFYQGASDNLAATQENERLALGVNNAQLTQQSSDLARAKRVEEVTRAAAAGTWAEAKEKNVPPDQIYGLYAANVHRSLIEANEPIEAEKWMKVVNSEKGQQLFRGHQQLIQSLMTGDVQGATVKGTELWNLMNPDRPASLVPEQTADAVAGSQAPMPTSWKLTIAGPDGTPTVQSLSTQQLDALLKQAATKLIAPEALLKSQIETQQKVAEITATEAAKGDQARATAAFKGEDWQKFKVGEHQEGLFQARTGSVIGAGGAGGLGGGAGEARLSDKQVDQVRMAAEGIVKSNGMSVMTEEGQRMLADITGRAGAYMRMNVLDEYGQPLDPNSAVSLAWRVAKDPKLEAKLQRGAPPASGGFGVQSVATTPGAAQPGAATQAAPAPQGQQAAPQARELPQGLDPKEWKWGRGKDGKDAIFKMNADGTAARDANQQLIPYQGPGAGMPSAGTAAPAGAAPVAAPAATASPSAATPPAKGAPVPPQTATPAVAAAPAAPAAPSQTAVIEKAKMIDAQIVKLKTQLNSGVGMGNVDARRAAQQRLADLESERAKLNISPEDIKSADKVKVRADMEKELAAAKARLGQLERAPKDSRQHGPLTEAQDLRSRIAKLQADLKAMPAAAGKPSAPAPEIQQGAGGRIRDVLPADVAPAAGQSPSAPVAAGQRPTPAASAKPSAQAQPQARGGATGDRSTPSAGGAQPAPGGTNGRPTAPSLDRPAAPRPQSGVNATDPKAFAPNMGVNVTTPESGAPVRPTPKPAAKPAPDGKQKPAEKKPAEKPKKAAPEVGAGANEFERTKGYGVRGKGKPQEAAPEPEAPKRVGLERLPEPDAISYEEGDSAPRERHLSVVREKVIAQAPERLRKADLGFFEKYAGIMPPEERQRWVNSLNQRIAKDGLNGLVPKTRQYTVGQDGNLIRSRN